MGTHLSPSTATSIANLKIVELCLEGLDRTVSQLEIFVQAIALRDQLHPNLLACSPPTYRLGRSHVAPIA